MSVHSSRESAGNGSPLAVHRFLLRFALAGANIFAWVFLFQFFYIVYGDLGQALAQSALLYALSNIIICLVTPYAARLLRGGARTTLILASLMIASAYVVLASGLQGVWDIRYTHFAIVFFACAVGLYRALYFVPYEIEKANQAAAPRRFALSEFLIALAPMIGGLSIVSYKAAPLSLLYVAAGLILISVVALLRLPDIHENFSWGYRKTFHELLAPQHRGLVVPAFLDGFSGAGLTFFWPIAAFMLLAWSYPMLGIVLSLTFLCALFVRAPIRAFIRHVQLHESRLTTTVLAISPWLFRLMVAGPLAIVLVDSYFYTTTPRRSGVDPFVFEQVSDGGSFVDEYTALKEIALAFGRTTAAIIGGLIALYLSVPLAFATIFIIAAIVSAIAALRRN